MAAPGRLEAAAALRGAGAEVWDDWPGPNIPPLAAILRRLVGRGINELHVEAGPTLTGALLVADLADELLVYMAPTILGPGRSFATLPVRTELPVHSGYHWHTCDTIGDDLRLRLRRIPQD